MAQKKPCIWPWETTKTAINVSWMYFWGSPCPSEIQLKSSPALTQPRCSLTHLKPQSPGSRPPPAPPLPRPAHKQGHACRHAHGHAHGHAVLGDAAPALAAMQPHGCGVGWSSRNGVLPSVRPAARPQPAAKPHPDTPSKAGPGNAGTHPTCFRAEDANGTGRVWVIKAALTDRTACFCFLCEMHGQSI